MTLSFARRCEILGSHLHDKRSGRADWALRRFEVARAFQARGGKDRRLELEEALLLHPSAKRINDLPAQHDVLVKLLAPQIKEAIAEPRVLRIGLVAEHRQRQIARRSQDFDFSNVNFDEAGWHL